MAPKPENDYSPVNSVAPETMSGRDYMTVESTPAQFGANIGEATQKLGATGEQIGQEASAYAIRQQGMINETAANTGETQYIQKSGEITGKFKSLEGIDAQAAIPQYQKDMTDLRTQIRGSLPAGAQRMFDQTTNKHEAYALSDAYSYGASQVKKAAVDSNNAIATNAISQLGNIDVASNDTRSGEQFGHIYAATGAMVEHQGYAAGGAMIQDEKTGKYTFADTPGGKQAEQVFNQELEKRTTQGYENQYTTLANNNVMTAYQKYQANRDKIPGEAQVKLDAYFTPKVKDFQARTTADGIMNDANQQFRIATITPASSEGSNPNNLGNVKTSQGSAKGTADFVNPATPTDGAMLAANNLRSGYQGMTLQQIGAKWTGESPDKVQAWVTNASKASGLAPDAVPNLNDPAALNSLLKGIMTAEKSPADRARFTDDVINQGVTASIAGKQPATSAAANPAPMSQADYYRTNYTQIEDKARQQAQQLHPDDPNFADVAVARVRQRMDDAITGQERAYKADADMLMSAANGSVTKGTKPTSMDQLRALSPEMNAAADRLMINQPMAYNALETKVIGKNEKDVGHGYFDAESKLFLPSTDPHAITSESQLWPLLQSGDITAKGRDQLAGLLKKMQDPDSNTEVAARKGVMDSVRDRIIPPYLKKFATPEQQAKMQTITLAVDQAVMEAKKSGKNMNEIYSLDPKKPGIAIQAAQPFMPTQAKQIGAKIDAATKASSAPALPPAAQDLMTQFRSNKISKEELETGLVKLGLVKSSAPEVSVPMAH